MRILWVKAGGIVPADTGSRIRSLHILKELAQLHSVTLFTYYAEYPGDQRGDLRGFAEVVANTNRVGARARIARLPALRTHAAISFTLQD